MDGEQKSRILKRYLKERSEDPAEVNLSEDTLASYADLDKLLDYIDLHIDQLFNINTLEADEDQWRKFTNILTYASSFNPGSPPTLIKVDIKKADFALQYWRNAHDISNLPKDNYYARPTISPDGVDEELNKLKDAARTKLYALAQTFPGATEFNPADVDQVNSRVTLIENLIKLVDESTPLKPIVQKRLNVLIDLNNINQLGRINIPQDNGPALTYCTLAEDTGGVTEKVSLISLGTVKKQLTQLSTRNDLTVGNYHTKREQYKLSTEAIIKLPKHGRIIEVQREAMALNFARILKLDTANSTLISYKNHPALFVLFDKIQLLKKFTSGKTFTARLGLDRHTYTHYSTIKPVGEGIQADRFVNDFGNFLGLLFLSSDTDAIGGYNQNKALRNARSLYIFDLVLMEDHKFRLDSRLSMEPYQFFMKHTRHGMGRNRTLIEDSSLISKYASLMQIQEMGDKMLQYTSHVASQHHHRAESLKKQLLGTISDDNRALITAELKEVEILERDAEKIKIKLQERMQQITDVLPKTQGGINSDEMRQTLILEKLIHNPVLFTDDARPYKNPWTNRHINKVEHINNLGNGTVQITFNAKIALDMVDFIKRRGAGDSIIIASPKVLTLSKAHLNALREDMLHPEHNLNLAPEINYLAAADLAIIKEAYKEGHGDRILNCIATYQIEMNNTNNTNPQKIDCIIKTEKDLKECIQTARDKGFGLHVLKKYYFDAQQQLQKLMNPIHMPGNLNQAFTAALKLDRVSEFNSVVTEAVAHNKLTDLQFSGFLIACIQKEARATNHTEARIESLALSAEAQRVIDFLKLPPVPLIVQLTGSAESADGLINLNPLTRHEADLALEHKVLADEPVLVSPAQPAVVKEDTIKEGITVSNS